VGSGEDEDTGVLFETVMPEGKITAAILYLTKNKARSQLRDRDFCGLYKMI